MKLRCIAALFCQRKLSRLLATALLVAGSLAVSARAEAVYVPNGSFESPETDFASPLIGSWQKAPQPGWYNDPMFPWSYLMGQFLNTPPGSTNHIENVDANQGAFIFALPGAGVFQDFNTVSELEGAPSHRFNALYEAGKSYALTVGVLGGGGGMSNGATFQISLYYRDAASNLVTIGATTITNTAALFPTNTHFTDFQVLIPKVKADDAWAGKHIGVQLLSTVGFDLYGGYWDVDNVRLTSSVVPNGSFEAPATDFAGPDMNEWQKAAQPNWYNDPMFPWPYLMGQFWNTPRGSSNHIDNVEGRQGAFLFALPDVAVFQDYNSIGGTNAVPNHEFAAKYEVGKGYTLTVGVLGSGGGMSNGATFELSLYYRDAASNIVIIGATTITNTPTLFPTNTHFEDFQVILPQVKSGDAWAGKYIGIKLASTTSFALLGGYWDVDDVRLDETRFSNGSFELPVTDFAGPVMDGWQKSPQPVWYNDPMFPWEYLVGQFLNTPRGASNHIDNVDGRQGAFLFALPGVGIAQDYNSVGGTNTSPTHEFATKFEVGKSYSVTAGVLGGSGGMSNGATLAISLYYRDAASNIVTIATTTVTNTPTRFPTNTHLQDFNVQVPVVSARDAWAGKYVGIQLLSTVGFDLIGGYWDVDDVRLSVVETPTLLNPGRTGEVFQFTLRSAPGRYEVQSTGDLLQPWSSLGVVTNFTGSLPLANTNSGNRFYRVRTSP